MPNQAQRYHNVLWLILLLALLTTGTVRADFPTHYRFRHLRASDGMSQGVVNATLQDNDGFVWLATQDGLNRYDGANFRIFTNDLDDPRSLSGNGVWCLALDDRGRVWYGTEDAGFGYYDPTSDDFTNFRFDPKAEAGLEAYEVSDLVVHSDQTIWIATASHGILHFDANDSLLVAFTPETEGAVKVPSSETWAVTVDGQGHVWGATSGGIVRFGTDGQPEQIFCNADDDSTSLVDNMSYRLFVDSQDRLWVGTIAGLDLFDRATGRFRHFRADYKDVHTLDGGSIAGIAEDLDGQIWVASMSGGLNLLDVETGKVQRVQHDPMEPHSLISDMINSVSIDENGLLWAATQKGASIMDLRAKDFLHLASGKLAKGHLTNPTVWSVAEDRNGDVWMGTEDGLHHYDPETNRMRVFKYDAADSTSVCNSSFSFVKSDRQGNLWIGSDQSGLSRYDFEHDNFHNYGVGVGAQKNLRDMRFFGYSEGPDGKTWLATMGGLLEHDASADSFIVHAADSTGWGLSTNVLRGVHADSRGAVWVSTWQETIERYDPVTGEAVIFKHDQADPTSISNNVAICFLEDSQRRLWVGTGNGLNLYDHEHGTFKRFGVKDGLPNATVYGLLEAPDGALWISTNVGLSRFDTIGLTFDNYDVSDGLQDNEFNSQSCFLGASGYMYFGGINGVTLFRPDEIRNSTLQPKVAVTNLQLLNRTVPVGPDAEGRELLTRPVHRTELITLKPSDRVLTLGFSAFDYAAPRGIGFAYMLEGFDPDWHRVGDRRHATYTNLPPGKYTFRVRATNHDGVWSSHEAALGINVLPPFWRTAWFMVAAALSILGLLRGAYSYRTRVMRARNRELRQSVAVRTADLEQEIVERRRAEERLREATDQALAATRAKSEFLANMSHEMRTPLNGVIGLSGALLDTDLDVDQLEYCQMVQSSANALLNVINDVLDFSKIEVGKLEFEVVDFHPRDVIDELGNMLSWQAYEKGLSYGGIVEAGIPAVVAGDPGRVRQVLLNLVGNAIKFTSDGSVTVRVSAVGEVSEGKCVIRWEVCDTGSGIPLEKQFRLFQSFSQVDASTTRRYGGTGLGLAISKQLVELMDGKIGFESTEGSGATFWFELPFNVVAQTSPIICVGKDQPVLLISCEGVELEVLRNHLHHRDRKYITAIDTTGAIQAVRQCRARGDVLSAVVVGRLPGLEDPAELSQKLIRPELQPGLPMVLLSDLGDRMDRRQLCKKGYQASLTWPVNHRRLFEVLAALAGEDLEAQPAILRHAVVPESGVRHLLLAEDNPINQRVAGLILTKLGFTFDVVGTGVAAVEALTERHYDAVLMDVQMPEMDGLEATRTIRGPGSTALNPQIPILAMTAHAMASDRQRCLAAGMNDHLTKPIQSESIAAALANHFRPQLQT
jgi:signal transduction histidine kinase/CheY-like chemotaxis protein/streptogramin lyase